MLDAHIDEIVALKKSQLLGVILTISFLFVA